MKYKILLFSFIAALLTSCSTYKAGQTPDDVYYSPAREGTEKTYAQSRHGNRYEEYLSHEDDQYLRMKIRNRDRWSTIDDYDYWYDSRYVPYYTYNFYRNNWNNYSWNNWNPGYYGNLYGVNYGYYRPNYWGVSNYYGYGGGYRSPYGGKSPTYFTKRPVNVSRPALSGYSNRNYNNNNLGNTILKAFTPSNSDNGYSNTNRSSSNTYTAPERTYTPSSSSSSGSSSSGSSGGGGVSRPARGGN